MKVICTLFKADTMVDGIKFAAHKLGTISEEISDEIGERLLKLTGYVRVGSPTKATAAKPTAAAATPAPAASGQVSAAAPAPAPAAAPASTPAPAATPAASA